MEPSGGAIAVKRAKPSDDGAGAGEDLLGKLPDDILVLILRHLDTAAAGQTSVLSRRWRRVWALLPELRFTSSLKPHLIASALVNHEAALRCLLVDTLDAAPASVTELLAAAVPRLSGRLVFQNRVPGMNAGDGGEEEAREGGAFELPCLEKATSVYLDLGFLGLAVPPAGVFARLKKLYLTLVRLHGPCELGDAVSSARCPCLERLSVSHTTGLRNLVIHSESLLTVVLGFMDGLRELTIIAPALQELELFCCFGKYQPVANISTPQLVSLIWRDTYDPSSVQFGSLGQLQDLSTSVFCVYGRNDSRKNRSFLWFLERFQVLHNLQITLLYPLHIGNFPYLMKDLTVLPCFEVLTIFLNNNGHAFGASLFHILRICSRLKALTLVLHSGFKAPSACPSDCICDEPTNWKTEDLTLYCLEEVEINMSGADHEVAFLKRLFSWATVLKRMKINFDYSISESKVRQLRQTVSSFSRPEIHLEFYLYHDSMLWHLLAPEDHGNGL